MWCFVTMLIMLTWHLCPTFFSSITVQFSHLHSKWWPYCLQNSNNKRMFDLRKSSQFVIMKCPKITSLQPILCPLNSLPKSSLSSAASQCSHNGSYLLWRHKLWCKSQFCVSAGTSVMSLSIVHSSTCSPQSQGSIPLPFLFMLMQNIFIIAAIRHLIGSLLPSPVKSGYN